MCDCPEVVATYFKDFHNISGFYGYIVTVLTLNALLQSGKSQMKERVSPWVRMCLRSVDISENSLPQYEHLNNSSSANRTTTYMSTELNFGLNIFLLYRIQ